MLSYCVETDWMSRGPAVEKLTEDEMSGVLGHGSHGTRIAQER
ncbi:MAG: hypothetical protein OEV14_10375 [Gammaproteobacteria bacterium]|nr:hypothetical protein [Gammaproteobacteria bacterium]